MFLYSNKKLGEIMGGKKKKKKKQINFSLKNIHNH